MYRPKHRLLDTNSRKDRLWCTSLIPTKKSHKRLAAYRIKANSQHVRLGLTGGELSEGVFLTNPIPYFRKFHRKPRKILNV